VFLREWQSLQSGSRSSYGLLPSTQVAIKSCPQTSEWFIIVASQAT
jgi:hypothetical protein